MAPRFPELQLPGATSPEPYLPSPQRDVSGGWGQIAQAADQFGARLGQMANVAAGVQAREHAVEDVQAGRVNPQDDRTTFGAAYNAVAKDALGVQRKASMAEAMNQAYIDHGDSPAALDTALSDIRKGFGSSQYADLDLALDGEFQVRQADLRSRALEAAKARAVDQGKANFGTTLANASQLLDQVASGAGFDAEGAQRVTAAYATAIQSVEHYGPKEAFEIGELKFAADPTRLNALGVDDIARLAHAANAGARTSWILGAVDRLPDATAKRAFLADLKEKWAAHDPMLAGLDGATAERLFTHIDAEADKTETDGHQAQARHGQAARDQIEALQWGGDYDRDTMISEAQASGDAGLIAQAHFFADNDHLVRGVLKTVVARQMGLLPEAGTGAGGPVWVDPTGHPVAQPGPGAPRGVRNNNPGNLKLLPDGHTWQGQTGADGPFAVFSSPQAGMAAAEQNLVAKQAKHGLQTIAQIIGDPTWGWAPAADHNDPAAYAATVARAAGVDPNAPVDLVNNAGLRHRVLTAMFGVENGGNWGVAAGAGNAWTPPADAPPGSPAYAAWASTQDGFTSDPVDFARGAKNRPAIASVPVLVPDGVTGDAAAAGAWAQAMQSRRALGATLAKTYGVPSRLLTNGERDYYKSLIAQDPTMSVKLAQAASGAIGGAGAVQFMRELGAGEAATIDAHLGMLAAHGSTAFAASAAQGIAFKAQGQKLERPDLESLDKETDRRREGFARLPQVLIAARGAAEMAMIADQAKGVTHGAAYYLDGALGATSANGRTYGGVANYRGRQTPLPMWLGQDRLDDAVSALSSAWAAHGVGPVYANGQPIPASDLGKMRILAQPNGRYRVINGRGDVVMARSGHAFEIDFDAGKDFLKRTLPAGSVR